MKIHNIRVTAYASEKEKEKLVEALQGFLPDDVAVSVKELPPEEEGGVFTHTLYVLKAAVSKKKDVRELAGKILSGLSDKDKTTLYREAESRVDRECNFYVRLSKEKLMEGVTRLSHRNPIHVKMKVAVYPAKKENAVKLVKEILEDG